MIFITYALLITNFYPYKSIYKEGNIKLTSNVEKYTIDGNKLSLTIKSKEKFVANYYFKTEKEKEYYENNLELGTLLYLEGELVKPTNNTVPNLFNYKKYLYNNHIYYILNIDNIKIENNNTKLLYYIKNKITKRIDKIDTRGYLRTFIIGDKNQMSEETLTNYQTNGVSHLFSISGMHISLIAAILLLILKKISYNNYFIYSVIISFLIFYLFLTNNQASILRTTIIYTISAINKCLNLKIKNIDLMLLVLILIIIIDPFLIYNIGFQFSYLISFTLILLSKKIKIQKKYLTKNLYISLVSFIVSLPICLYNFYQINILSIFLNIILIPLVSIFVFPLSILTFIFPFLYKILSLFINILETINNISLKITIFTIILSKPSLLLIIIYYLIIYLSLYSKRFFIILTLLIILHKNSIYFDNNLNISIIDVSQGDSIIIKLPKQDKAIMIDTGGIVSFNNEEWKKRKNNYSITINKTIPYLKSIGISKIDYLILTHGDYDHMGEAINLVNNFKVEKVIFNCGPYNELEQELIKVLDKKDIKYYSCIKELNIDKNKLYFLQTKEFDNENDNSNVIYTELNGYKFLFMGDASSTTEKEIMGIYNLPDIDVLKVGHHGSKTSSSKDFINETNPKYSIISVGKNNRYGHPNKEVLDNLINSKIYRTDEDGSIMFKIKNNKLKIKTYSP